MIHTTQNYCFFPIGRVAKQRDNPLCLMTIASRSHPFPSRTGP
ncbi:hypothetical protein BSLA_01f2223 [Burkholderia stabilis]|nr:hypothetical protein BSLA_01f2223 [Burkholderia stabilis]